ncbi:hypothetical protein [Pseudomonas nicosulfuronedens]
MKFQVRCFTHEAEKPVNVSFATTYIPEGRLNIGYVQYEKSGEAILLKFVRAEEKILADDRPAEVTAIWKEVFKTGFGGEYKVVSQGANIYGFSYKGNSSRVIDFEYNSSAIVPGYTGCNWN